MQRTGRVNTFDIKSKDLDIELKKRKRQVAACTKQFT